MTVKYEYYKVLNLRAFINNPFISVKNEFKNIKQPKDSGIHRKSEYTQIFDPPQN